MTHNHSYGTTHKCFWYHNGSCELSAFQSSDVYEIHVFVHSVYYFEGSVKEVASLGLFSDSV